MKTTHVLAALVVLAGFTQISEAGLFNKYFNKGSAKCCDCVPTCQPECCQPVIVKPCRDCNAYCYQRRRSTLKRPCCNGIGNGCPAACCPVNSGCCDNGCGNNACCDTACGTGCCNNNCCEDCCDPSCCDECCDPSCCDDCCDTVCCDDSCILAELIYQSQTACYARQRRRAVRQMSWTFDCACYPELMCALIYALNDTDERVRAQAANEIGDELRKNSCCCSQEVVSALTCALADCDWRVRWYAKRALKQCGYKVVDPCYTECCEVACCETGCCDSGCCDSGCTSGCTTGHAAPTAPPVADHAAPSAPADLPESDEAPVAPAAPEAAPAAEPMPEAAPEPPSAYFPKFYPRHSSVRPASSKKGLAGLLGLAN
ncbi:MAG: hypothetical protein KDA86_13895 [Planctomycetaceae bacterium]|nr:hypothetical protein [Planctomycetaceae bacterium]MCA9110169.1 hypothetical protein [Planctomycetaceae bacterium]